MDALHKEINKNWEGAAHVYWWGDPLDVRYCLCEEVATLRNERVLDFGCNVGVILRCLDASNTGVGIDIEPKVLEIARAVSPANLSYILADSFEEPHEKESFDTVILGNVFPQHDFHSEHTPEELITHVHSLLKPGGKILITTPNAANAYYRVRGKIIDLPRLEQLLGGERWNTVIYGWNPFPMRAGHILKYVPGIFTLLDFLMRKGIRKSTAVAFYAVATKR